MARGRIKLVKTKKAASSTYGMKWIGQLATKFRMLTQRQVQNTSEVISYTMAFIPFTGIT